MKIVAMGRTKILYDTIKLLVSEGFEVPLICTCKASPEYLIKEGDFEYLASKMGSKFIYTEKGKTKDVIQVVGEIKPDIAISVNWVSVIRKTLIDKFKFGILNSHTGDLPRYRGNACPNWAIINGEKEIGLTVHLMDEGLDTGPIVLKKKKSVTEKTTIGEVYQWMYEMVPKMYLESISGLTSGAIKPKEQSNDPKDALRCYPRIPSDNLIDWRNDAVFIDRLVRASSAPFSGAFTYLNGKKVIVWSGEVKKTITPYLAMPGHVMTRNKDGSIDVSTGDGVYCVKEIEVLESGRVAPTKAIKSLRTRLGI